MATAVKATTSRTRAQGQKKAYYRVEFECETKSDRDAILELVRSGAKLIGRQTIKVTQA
jgi:hypothetical protein